MKELLSKNKLLGGPEARLRLVRARGGQEKERVVWQVVYRFPFEGPPRDFQQRPLAKFVYRVFDAAIGERLPQEEEKREN